MSPSLRKTIWKSYPTTPWTIGVMAILGGLFIYPFVFNAPHRIVFGYDVLKRGFHVNLDPATIEALIWPYQLSAAIHMTNKKDYAKAIVHWDYVILELKVRNNANQSNGVWDIPKVQESGMFALAYFHRGRAHGNHGTYNGIKSAFDRAIQDFDKFFELAPGATRWNELKKIVYFSLDGDQQTVAEVVVAEAHLSRGKIYFEKDQYNSAIEDYTKGIDLLEGGPTYPDGKIVELSYYSEYLAHLYAARGKAYEKLGKKNVAERDFESAKEKQRLTKNRKINKNLEKSSTKTSQARKDIFSVLSGADRAFRGMLTQDGKAFPFVFVIDSYNQSTGRFSGHTEWYTLPSVQKAEGSISDDLLEFTSTRVFAGRNDVSGVEFGCNYSFYAMEGVKIMDGRWKCSVFQSGNVWFWY